MDSNISFPEGWTAPPELTGALPRESRLTEAGSAMAMIATLFLLAAIAIVIWGSIRAVKQMVHTSALRREGLPACRRGHAAVECRPVAEALG